MSGWISTPSRTIRLYSHTLHCLCASVRFRRGATLPSRKYRSSSATTFLYAADASSSARLLNTKLLEPMPCSRQCESGTLRRYLGTLRLPLQGGTNET